MNLRLLAALAFTSLSCGLTHAQSEHPAFSFAPDIHGNKVIFTAEGDLWLGNLKTDTAQRITSAPGTETDAHFSPDGLTIAFTADYDGHYDVYTMPTSGGTPKRLTYSSFSAQSLGWTPDGKSVVFRSYEGSMQHNRLYTVPEQGGQPVLLPVPQGEFAAIAPDGLHMAYVPVSADWQHWYHYQGGEADHIWLTNLKTHTFRRLTNFAGISTTPVWCNGKLYCISELAGIANLFRINTKTDHLTQVTHFTHYAGSYPSSDGHRIVLEHNNMLAVYDPATQKTTGVDFRIYSDHLHARPYLVHLQKWLHWASIGPTGKRIVIESRGQLVTVPASHGVMHLIAPLPGTRSWFPVWSPDGKWIAFVSDRSGNQELWVTAADGSGVPRQLTHKHEGPFTRPVWSPDSKLIVLGDRSMRTMLVDAASGKTTLIAQSDRAGSYNNYNSNYHFSPDSKWVTYTYALPNWQSAVLLYNIATGKNLQVTPHDMNCYGATFSSDGKYLAYIADRDFNAARMRGRIPSFSKTGRPTLLALNSTVGSPFLARNEEENTSTPAAKPAPKSKTAVQTKVLTIDTTDFASRVIDTPLPGGNYGRVRLANDRLYVQSGSDLISLNLKSRKQTTIAQGISSFQLSADNKKLLISRGNNDQIMDAEATATVPSSTGAVNLASYRLQVSPRAEWQQIFNESWRIMRDFYFDPNMAGLNWPAVKAKYVAQLAGVEDRGELNYILGNMLAELNTGHAYVFGGDSRTSSIDVPNGFLGGTFEAVPNTNAVKISRLYNSDGYDLSVRSPLLAPGLNVHVGDYILAVNGNPVLTTEPLTELLIDTANKTTAITVNTTPTNTGSRVIYVKPLNAGQEQLAKYYHWVHVQDEYVKTHGGPEFAYIQIPDMENRGMEEFAKHYYANNQEAKAIIYDVRNNGGGYISGQLLVQMNARPFSYFKPRYGASWTRYDFGFGGYAAALCNRYSGSDAEEFADAFQRLHMGPVIGTRTWGGEVGSGGGYHLIDGGEIFVPNYGEWVSGKNGTHWVIEGHGVVPNMIVRQNPAAVMAGDNPQLDAAITYLKNEMKTHPLPQLTHPAFPVKAYPPLKAMPAPAVKPH